MEKELGLEKIKAVADKLSERANDFSVASDTKQAIRFKNYVKEQEKTIDSIRILKEKLSSTLKDNKTMAFKVVDEKITSRIIDFYLGRDGNGK